MKSYRAKSFIRLIAIIACAALVGCTDDAKQDGKTPADAGVDTVQPEDDAASDATAPNDDAASDATPPKDTHTTEDPDTDSGELDPGPDATDVADEEPLPATGSTCEDAVDITAGGLWDNRTTVGAGDNYSAPFSAEGCPAGQYTGPDEVFVLSPENTTTYDLTITSTDPDFKHIVYIRDDCAQDRCLAGSKLLDDNNAIRLNNIEVPGGESYYVIVDTISSSGGAYTIEAEIQ